MEGDGDAGCRSGALMAACHRHATGVKRSCQRLPAAAMVAMSTTLQVLDEGGCRLAELQTAVLPAGA